MDLDKILKSIKDSKFTTEERSQIIAALLTSINALPIRDVIKFDMNGILIDGKRIDAEQAMALKSGADMLRDSNIRKLIHNQIKYEAIKLGVSQGLTPDMILFSKAAIWCIEQEDKLVESLTGGE